VSVKYFKGGDRGREREGEREREESEINDINIY
jgi:hypothetical protein